MFKYLVKLSFYKHPWLLAKFAGKTFIKVVGLATQFGTRYLLTSVSAFAQTRFATDHWFKQEV